MKTFRVELACDISAYRTEVIEAIDEADLLKKLRETADDLADCPEFDPDFGCQSGLRALSYREGDDGAVCGVEPVVAGHAPVVAARIQGRRPGLGPTR